MTNGVAKPTTRRILMTGGALAVFLTVMHTAIDTVSSMLTALLPTIQARFGVSETVLAMLVATLSFSSSMMQPLFGAVSDRLGSRLVGALGIVINAAVLSLIGVAPTVAVLFAILLVGGLGSAAFHPAGTSLARTAGTRNSGLAVSLFGAGGTVGVALGPVLVLYVVAMFGLGFTPWLMIPGVVLGVLTYFVVPPLERAPRTHHHMLLDVRLIAGPVGLLCVVGTLASITYVTFTSAMPLWLVRTQGVAPDDPLIGWTLAAFSLSAAAGAVTGGALSVRVSRRVLVSGTLLLALLPLYALFALEPGTLPYFLAVIAAGAVIHTGSPLLIISAQDLAPHAMATASGMLMGLTTGTAGVLYIGVGRLQEMIGLAPAMSISFLSVIPAALVAFYVLTKYSTPANVAAQTTATPDISCVCTACVCAPCVSVTTPAATATHQRAAQR